MCVACLRTQVDITEGIPKQTTIYFCKGCERYLQPPNSWVLAALESRELLALCLKKIKGLSKVRLIDAGFVWTEPHSKRLKVKLSIQKEVLNGAVLQQVFIIEYIVHGQMCDDCHRVEAKDYWRALVQIRQKIQHKKTLLYLEQLILKHDAHSNTTNIKSVTDGIDFYYSQKSDARRFVDFLQQAVPCRYQTAQELISHDIHSNTYNYKFTFSVEIAPICKDSIICLPAKLAHQLGNLSQICICIRVTQSIHIIDPSTLAFAELSGVVYWRTPFKSLCDVKQLQRFMVISCDLINDNEKRHISGQAHISNKHMLAEVWCMRECEFGNSDAQQYFCRTHLGHLLNEGDTVLGLDLRTANFNDENLEKMNIDTIPDLILVKKLHGNSEKRLQKRKWKLKHLINGEENTRDYVEFLEDLEEDDVYRQHVNIYKDNKKVIVEKSDTDDEDLPQISLQEMLDDLHIDEEDMQFSSSNNCYENINYNEGADIESINFTPSN